MRRPRALILLLALTACTSGSTPAAAPPTPATSPSPLVLPTPKPTAVDEASANPEPSYRPLRADEPVRGFVPTSVSFVSNRTGWFLGSADCGKETCGVLMQTRDAGRTFRRLTPPPVRVTEVRFADLQQGWAFGNGRSDTGGNPGLWRTHDGGQHWKKVLENPVPSLEVGGGSVWAIVLDLGGTYPQVFRGQVGGDRLRRVTDAGNRSASLTLGHRKAWVVGLQGAGPIAPTLLVVDATGRQSRHESPCRPPEASDPLLAVTPTGRVYAACSGEPSAGTQRKSAYMSNDSEQTWTRLPDPPVGGYTGPFDGTTAATTRALFVSGGRSPIYRRVGNGPWRAVLLDEDGTGFRFVGMTDDAHGVAIGQQSAWMTVDGGTTWRRLRFG